MKSSNLIPIAIIGLGWVATNRHIPIIQNHPQLRFFGVVDKHSERIQTVCAKFPWLQSSQSSNGEMPWGDNVRAVLIATDPLNHYQLAKKMLQAGKHVLMEKPLTMTPDEAQELQKIATQSGVSLCVVHNFQFARSTLKLHEMIINQRLGEILSIEAVQFSNPLRRLPVWYEKLPFGLFYDESPHMFYLLESLAGQPIQYLKSTVLHRDGQNTPSCVTAYYTNGNIPIRLNMNFESSLSEWHIAVLGTKAIGIVDIFRDILVLLPNDGSHRAREILSSSVSTITTHIRGFLSSGILQVRGKLFYGSDIVWQQFVNELDGIRPAKDISALRGLRIVELQHELMAKSETVILPAL
jgi:scyllo-inositol 2-dehydrogenase (NADP+)